MEPNPALNSSISSHRSSLLLLSSGASDRYHNGNDDDAGQGRGFGHTGFLGECPILLTFLERCANIDEVDDLNASCEWLEAEGVVFRKRPQDGNMKSELPLLSLSISPSSLCFRLSIRSGSRWIFCGNHSTRLHNFHLNEQSTENMTRPVSL
jgi:hypothetical protein